MTQLPHVTAVHGPLTIATLTTGKQDPAAHGRSEHARHLFGDIPQTSNTKERQAVHGAKKFQDTSAYAHSLIPQEDNTEAQTVPQHEHFKVLQSEFMDSGMTVAMFRPRTARITGALVFRPLVLVDGLIHSS